MSMTSRPRQAQSQPRFGLWRRIKAQFMPTGATLRRTLPIAAALLGIALLGVVVSSLLLPESEALPRDHAIWLDRAWTFGGLDSDQLNASVAEMTANGIGKIYAYVSTLGLAGRWESSADGRSFMDSRGDISNFVAALRNADESLAVYAWVEVWTHDNSADGYRLDDEALHENIADFSKLLVDQMGFDGLLLEIKPMFTDNGDVISLIRRVRSAVGLDKPIGIAVTADLTPHNLRTQNIAAIAPGTMWTDNFKKRVAVSADEIVLMLYQSYRQQTQEYFEWVAYHIETYVNLLETTTEVYASIPHYASASAAHNPDIETMTNALQGIYQGLQRLSEDSRSLLTGVAIYADRRLSEADWSAFRAGWLRS
ncbi:MAG: hypothetical protein F4Y70_03950 [Chloroflexi bacterium]|nr:hypothetical protein [Chloroflexota bacterium]MCY3583575.1 hypothetical protein [Chloroflexota bacterium]MXX82611.1 hypothetical protein [Chloroflexota bacterium]MYA93047.1 hypothetical protein [Chloroflexota bacterium]MYD39963.1 hypothetical protein [Chloroflexota bacterium]